MVITLPSNQRVDIYATTGASYVDQDTANSIAQYDVSATVISAGSLVGGVVLGKTDSTRINFTRR